MYGDDINAAFMGGEKTRSASFNGPFPLTWEGYIVAPMEQMQQRDYYEPDKLLWWDEAETRPKMQFVIKIQTDVREDDDDDGVRALYIKFNSHKAVKDAIRAAGAPGPEVGGYLALTYYDNAPPPPGQKKHKGQPPKLYRAEYTRPDPQAAVNAAFDTEPIPEQASVMERARGAVQQARTVYENQHTRSQQGSAVMARLRNGQGRPQDEEPPF